MYRLNGTLRKVMNPYRNWGYIMNRPIGVDPQLNYFPKIESLLNRLNERQSFKGNPILFWEPGVVGYAEDGVTPVYKDK